MNMIDGIYHLEKKIGAGSFGQVYCGENIQTHEKIAAKTESLKTSCPQLAFEFKLYQYLSHGANIPRVYWYGQEKNHNVMIMQLLGRSLESLLHHCGGHFSLKTVLMLADQMLSGLQYIHSKNFIHRDIKPDNFVIGTGKLANQVFIIDFGLSKKYCDTKTHRHIQYIEGKSLTGTARYASVSALKGNEQSRRDDLEALGYVWIYLLKGKLPWMGLEAKTREEKYKKIAEVKSHTSFTSLCQGFPLEFVTYFENVRHLHFTETPDYCYLRKLFRDLFVRLGYHYDYQYDWVKDEDAPLKRTLSVISVPLSSQNLSMNVQHSSLPMEVQVSNKMISGNENLKTPNTINTSSSKQKEIKPSQNHLTSLIPSHKQISQTSLQNKNLKSQNTIRTNNRTTYIKSQNIPNNENQQMSPIINIKKEHPPRNRIKSSMELLKQVRTNSNLEGLCEPSQLKCCDCKHHPSKIPKKKFITHSKNNISTRRSIIV